MPEFQAKDRIRHTQTGQTATVVSVGVRWMRVLHDNSGLLSYYPKTTPHWERFDGR